MLSEFSRTNFTHENFVLALVMTPWILLYPHEPLRCSLYDSFSILFSELDPTVLIDFFPLFNQALILYHLFVSQPAFTFIYHFKCLLWSRLFSFLLLLQLLGLSLIVFFLLDRIINLDSLLVNGNFILFLFRHWYLFRLLFNIFHLELVLSFFILILILILVLFIFLTFFLVFFLLFFFCFVLSVSENPCLLVQRWDILF